ncbi:MAG: helical backbone metal receptor, partial [Polyangiales bacterium]
AVPSVGGTKGFDVDAVRALRPDLVLANQEENSRPQVQALIEAGVRVHVSFPCTVAASNRYLESLSVLLGVEATSEAVRLCEDALTRALAVMPVDPLRVFVPIWKDPWMTFDGRAYASDLLRVCGAHNVFDDRVRKYPLAADLGQRAAWDDARVAGRDTRYPRVQLDEVIERGARAVLFPDEPYAFSEIDEEPFAALDTTRPLWLERVDGKDLFWYGTRVAEAVDRLRTTVKRIQASH